MTSALLALFMTGLVNDAVSNYSADMDRSSGTLEVELARIHVHRDNTWRSVYRHAPCSYCRTPDNTALRSQLYSKFKFKRIICTSDFHYNPTLRRSTYV